MLCTPGAGQHMSKEAVYMLSIATVGRLVCVLSHSTLIGVGGYWCSGRIREKARRSRLHADHIRKPTTHSIP